MSEIEVKRKSRRAVFVYTTALIVVVIFFIGLSYFIEQRNDRTVDALHEQNTTAMAKIDVLQTENIDMKLEIEALQTKIDALDDENAEIAADGAELDKELATLQRAYDALLEEHFALINKITLITGDREDD